VLLIAGLAGLGWRQGVIRVAFSLVGILIASLLSLPLAKLIKPLLGIFGMHNPVLLGILGPLVAFIIVLAAFKAGALATHQKVDVYFKYKAGDLRLSLWERLNHRLGLCLGIFNGVLYFVLLSWAMYCLSYWTVQAATADQQPTTLNVLNRLGKDLDATGMSKVARSIDRLPETYYETADVVGLVYNNALLEARLSRYPAFLTLAEKPEFQDIANDAQFTEMRQKREPIINIINYPKTQAILKNGELMKQIKGVLVPDLADLRAYLETGHSPKYDQEQILGRWDFDLIYTVAVVARTKPNMSASERQKLRQGLSAQFGKTKFVATTEHEAYLKNIPKGGGSAELQNVTGKWDGAGGKYMLTMQAGRGELSANVERDRLIMKGEGLDLAFSRED